MKSSKKDKPIVYGGTNGTGRAGHKSYISRLNELRADYINSNKNEKQKLVEMVSKEFDFRREDGEKLTKDQINTKINKSLTDRRLYQLPPSKRNRAELQTKVGPSKRITRRSDSDLPAKRKPRNDDTTFGGKNNSAHSVKDNKNSTGLIDVPLEDKPQMKRQAKKYDNDSEVQEKQEVGKPSMGKNLHLQKKFRGQKKSSCILEVQDFSTFDDKKTTEQNSARQVLQPVIATPDSAGYSFQSRHREKTLPPSSNSMNLATEPTSRVEGSIDDTDKIQKNIASAEIEQINVVAPTYSPFVHASDKSSAFKRSQHHIGDGNKLLKTVAQPGPPTQQEYDTSVTIKGSIDDMKKNFPWYNEIHKNRMKLIHDNATLHAEYNKLCSYIKEEKRIIRQWEIWVHNSPSIQDINTVISPDDNINFDDGSWTELKQYPTLQIMDSSGTTSPYQCFANYGTYLEQINIQNQELNTVNNTLKHKLCDLKQKLASFNSLFEQMKKV